MCIKCLLGAGAFHMYAMSTMNSLEVGVRLAKLIAANQESVKWLSVIGTGLCGTIIRLSAPGGGRIRVFRRPLQSEGVEQLEPALTCLYKALQAGVDRDEDEVVRIIVQFCDTQPDEQAHTLLALTALYYLRLDQESST